MAIGSRFPAGLLTGFLGLFLLSGVFPLNVAAQDANRGKPAGADFFSNPSASDKDQPKIKKRVAVVRNGVAPVSEENTVWRENTKLFLSAFAFAKPKEQLKVYQGEERAGKMLNLWYERGEAAGNLGDLYDNRDNGHSRLSKELFPQVSHIDYDAAAKAAKLHYGASNRFLFNAITFGNSSTALTGGARWRSQARFLLTAPQMAERLYQQYANNHLYIYPEHRDHDPDNGDLFPANTPYMIVSQGSSSSDKPFLRAVSMILAAFRPEVKAFLRKQRLVMPTVQMIFRTGMKSVRIKKDYLGPRAHPSVFYVWDMNLEKMVNLARAMRKEDVPPQVQLSVVDESGLLPGVNYFGPSKSDEVLFDTPGAVARIIRSTHNSRYMKASVANTKDPNGKPLKFIWRVIRGDAQKTIVKPLNEDGSEAEIRVSWQDRTTVSGFKDVKSSRVDIAVFADNGAHYSAPAFISFYFPSRQKRFYDEAGRLMEIDYQAANLSKRYEDPLLFSRRNWRDRYHYTDEGELLGWVRLYDEGTKSFTRHGARIIKSDEDGRPLMAELIQYELKPSKNGFREVHEQETGRLVKYTYRDRSDLLGKMTVCADNQCGEG